MHKRKSLFMFLSFVFLLALFPAACGKPADAPEAGGNAAESLPAESVAETPVPETGTPAVPSSSENTAVTAASLSDEDALRIALEHAGLSEADITRLKISLEYERQTARYDVEFCVNDTEYDYEIDAADGTILGFDQKWEDDHRSRDGSGRNQPPETSPAEGSFSEEDAISLALSRMPGATEEDITSFKTDYDHGKEVYEIEIRYNGSELEMEIDAATGKILEMDYDD